MLGDSRSLKNNVFTERGFESVDSLVAATLKRGSGRGEPPCVDVVLIESAMIAEVPETDINVIRSLVDSSTSATVNEAADLVLGTVHKTVKRAQQMKSQI